MSEFDTLIRRHLLAGWGGLFVFLLLGLLLELLHGFKASWYLAADNETRRLLWVLAHAHGALLAVLNLVFALTIDKWRAGLHALRWISLALLIALVLMPTGFLTGGLVIYQGDPGPGIVLALVGAAVLICGVGALVLQLWRDQR